ncbi:hypothetical protein BH11ARM2_BH11ARM2_23820 [soil metagenome]
MSPKSPPPFRRILDDLEARIARADFRPGEPLPTRLELAVHYDAARATVDKALAELARRGRVSGGSGKRTVVLERAAPSKTAIGVIWNWTPDQQSEGGEYLDLLFRGVREACAEFLLEVHFRSAPFHTYAELVAETDVHGLLLVRPDYADAGIVARMRREGVPAVTVPGCLDGVDAPGVAVDNAGGIAAAVEHLAQAGHREIGFLGLTSTLPDHFERLQGFLATMASHGLPVRPEWMRLGHEPNPKRYTEALAGWLAPGSCPTAVIASDFHMALALLDHLRSAGLAMPHDVSVITFDDPPAAAQLWPPLTAIQQPVPLIGYRGVQRLVEQIAGSEVPKRDLLSTRIVVRESVRRLA